MSYREPQSAGSTTLYGSQTASVSSSFGYALCPLSPMGSTLRAEYPRETYGPAGYSIPTLSYRNQPIVPPPRPLKAYGNTGANSNYFELYKPKVSLVQKKQKLVS